MAFLDDLLGDKVTPEFIDQAWNLAQEVSFEEGKQGIRSAWTEELNRTLSERFVLDALMRKVIEDSKSISTHDGGKQERMLCHLDASVYI